ncbi:MAG: hypothetical protein COX62_02330 [Deltaproteobacteria bacterium CG_4_10_14_0_2_um_filter_43_8]|nr:MAG: hypothetical protein COV43_07680 [Deltaproteobacteria bacterium CG11_big_fil_rev_8_21_14_0_20_42_23]PJA21478.1 MAG: hypothetical protein COX62_02330 [Deltaproteobacteria bacterium CG_4_10_14_0_2_um_filter_43_8]PJC63343.1 MAG: hypothetical protein CO021_10045 [Deltaproteobacteria bacterium CG_4_9_14_0_2_um_filter_42_21]
MLGCVVVLLLSLQSRAFADCDATPTDVVKRYTVTSAISDTAYQSAASGGHSIWMPGFYDGDQSKIARFYFQADSFLDVKEDGTATLHGIAKLGKESSAAYFSVYGGDEWEIELSLTRLTGAALAAVQAKKELQHNVQTDFVTSRWEYYTFSKATWTQVGGVGSVVVTPYPPNGQYRFQVGEMANGKNLLFGASTWFDFVHDDGKKIVADTRKTSWHGDINVNLEVICNKLFALL